MLISILFLLPIPMVVNNIQEFLKKNTTSFILKRNFESLDRKRPRR